jgi:hypothetical protein
MHDLRLLFVKTILVLSLMLMSACRVLYVHDDDDDKRFTLHFQNAQDWQVGFADYPVETTEDYALRAVFTPMPAPLSGRGLLLAANNHNADVFLFAARKLGGLQRNQPYRASYRLRLGSNLSSGCVGRDASLLFLKAGASREQPRAGNIGAALYAMNIDKGNQAANGADSVSLGNADSGQACASGQYRSISRSSQDSLRVFSDANGELWVFAAVDAGLAGVIDLYFDELVVEFEAL